MEKLWLKQYQQGVPYEINLEEYSSLTDLFHQSCQQHAHQVAYANMNSTITYAQLNEQTKYLAAYLQSLDLPKGARVAIIMPNLIQYPITLFATLRAGFVVINTNPLYTKDEIVHQLNDAGAQVVVVLANFAHVIEHALLEIPTLKHIIVTQLGDSFPTIKRFIVNGVVRFIKRMVKPYHIPGAVSFNQALKHGQSLPFHSVHLTHDDIAFLQYTGGTTGVAKAAILTHGNMIANVLQAYAWISPLALNTKDTIVTALPLYHIFSLTANCLTFLKAGAKNILITNPRDLDGFIKDIKHSKFTAITGVNTLFNALLNHPKFTSVDFSRLKLALSGGMALQKSVALRWHEITKARVLEAYGLTETSPAVTINPMYLEEYNGSIGLPISSTEISIRDDNGQEVTVGKQGELCVKGPQVTKGYWKRSDETALIFWPDGFLRTGDIAKVDEKGFVYLVDRKKDMIIVSGFNVYPNEVEHVISMMPGVLEVGVVGDIENSQERVKACVVKKDPNLTQEDIMAFCRERLTAYKVPKIVVFYTELPKTNVGKILRRALK